MLVGDILNGVRVRINDLPRGMPAPSSVTIAASVVGAGGSNLPTGTYYLKATFVNQWGETLSTPEAGPFTIGANQGIQVTSPDPSLAYPGTIGATGIRLYFGNNGPNSENQWIAVAIGQMPYTIISNGTTGVPPTRNTSFFPDIDGQRVNSYTLYDWLNQSLEMASQVSGGIPDMTGLPTVNGNSSYVIPGLWNKLDHGWWDGYIFTLAGKDSLFYRNVVPGVPSFGVVQQVADRIVIELQPQPNRSGAVTTIANFVSPTDTSITLTDVSGFKLPFGMASLGPNPQGQLEIISFSSISGGTLVGCIRGLGGSIPATYAGGGTIPAAECNLRLTGLRVFNSPSYSPGSAATYLPVPAGWRSAIQDFMVSRFREAEGNIQEANRLMQQFTQTIKDVLKGNKLVGGPRQCGFPGAGSLDTFPSAGSGGRIIVP